MSIQESNCNLGFRRPTVYNRQPQNRKYGQTLNQLIKYGDVKLFTSQVREHSLHFVLETLRNSPINNLKFS